MLEVHDLTVRFGGITALGGVGFEVRGGEMVGLIGPNGAGKTTLFNCLTRRYDADGGSDPLRGPRPAGGAAARDRRASASPAPSRTSGCSRGCPCGTT